MPSTDPNRIQLRTPPERMQVPSQPPLKESIREKGPRASVSSGVSKTTSASSKASSVESGPQYIKAIPDSRPYQQAEVKQAEKPKQRPRENVRTRQPTRTEPEVATDDPSPFISRPKVGMDINASPVPDNDPVPSGVDFDSIPAVAGAVSATIDIDDRPKPTRECARCERRFNIDVVNKHEKICKSQKRRPQFNSKQHRLADLKEAQKQVQVSASMRPAETPIKVKRAGWKEKSDQLRAAIALARSTDPEKRKIYEAELARVNEAVLTRCELCGRSFNPEAAQRHIPICKNKAMMMPRALPGKITVAGTGGSVKLPALNRARSEVKQANLRETIRMIAAPAVAPSQYRGSSLIKSHFR
jgi:hypothetical protein